MKDSTRPRGRGLLLSGFLRRRAMVAGVAAGLLLGAGLGAAYFPAAGHDDSHITFWASHALARLGAMVNYNGVRIEQSSSLSLVLWLALLEKLTGAPPPLLGWLSSIGFAALALVAVTCLARRAAPRLAWLAAPLLATSLPFLYWSTSGMETSLAALLGTGAALGAAWFVEASDAGERAGAARRKQIVPVAAVLALFAGARPEAPVILLALAATAVVWSLLCMIRPPGARSRPVSREGSPAQAPAAPRTNAPVSPARSRKERRVDTPAATPDLTTQAPKNAGARARRRFERSLWIFAAAAAPVLLLAGIRKALFGLTVPNPAAMKAGAFDLAHGFEYLTRGLGMTDPVLAPALAVAAAFLLWGVARRRLSTAAVLAFGLAAASAGFVVASGGDWMSGGRFVAPAMPAFVVVLLAALHRAVRPRSRVAIGALAGLLVTGLNVRAIVEYGGSRNNTSHTWAEARRRAADARATPGMEGFPFPEIANRAHRRDAKLLPTLERLIDRLGATPEQPITLASGQAGMVAYHVAKEHFGAIRFLDLYSLTGRDLFDCLPPQNRHHMLQGIRFELEPFLRRYDELGPRCGIARPAIVFDADRAPAWLARYGYRLMYDNQDDLGAYIAVHNSFADRL